jgi:hypothetical protein
MRKSESFLATRGIAVNGTAEVGRNEILKEFLYPTWQ